MHTINPDTPRITTPLKGEVDDLKVRARDPVQDQAQASSLCYKTVKIILGTAALAIGGLALFEISYPNKFSPSLDTHDVDNSVYKNFYNKFHGEHSLECDSLALKAETLFFNLYESNEYLSSIVGDKTDDINGALQGFLEDRNLNAFKCTYHTYKENNFRRERKAQIAAEITGTPYYFPGQDPVGSARNKLLERVLKRFERTDSYKFAKFLLDEGANPDRKFDSIKPLNPLLKYSTPLLYAHEHKDESLMNAFLERGARPEEILSIEDRILKSPAYQEEISTLNYIVDQTSHTSSEASCSPYKETIKKMIPFHSFCKDDLDSDSCRLLRYSIFTSLWRSVCGDAFDSDTYFTQPERETTKEDGVPLHDKFRNLVKSMQQISSQLNKPNPFDRL